MDLSGLEDDPFQLELLPCYIDSIAQEHPTRTWAVRPQVSSDLSKGFEDISYSIAAKAINRAAWFFETELGKPEPDSFPVVAYIGNADLRYLLFPIALVKVGYQVLLLSDVSSLEMRQYLVSASGCKIIARAASRQDEPLSTSTDTRALIVPELDILLSPESVEVYPYNKSAKQGLNDLLMILHTSGTSSLTGRPKLVRYVLGTVCCTTGLAYLPQVEGCMSKAAKMAELERVYAGFRISHAGGIVLAMSLMFLDTSVVVGGDNPLSIDALESALKHADVDSILVPSLLLERAVKRPDILERLSKLSLVIFAGGRLPAEVGNAISKYVHLFSSYSSTEYVSIPTRVTRPEDWRYIDFDPVYSGITWVRYPPDDPTSNLFEAVVVRNPDPAIRRCCAVFWNFPNMTEWPMSDLFEPHPTEANHWKYVGRKDDMIILAHGINFMPTFFEQEILGRDPRIAKAVLCGDGETHLAVLIELATPVEGTGMIQQVKDDLWPLIEKCNQRTSKATQIARNAVIIAEKQRPLPKGGKGDVQRKRAQALYRSELDAVFGRM